MPITVRELRDYIDEAIKNEELYDEGEVFVSLVLTDSDGIGALEFDLDVMEVFPSSVGLSVVPEAIALKRRGK